MEPEIAIPIGLFIVSGALAIRYYSQKSRLQKEKLQLNEALIEQREAYQKLKSESLRFQLTPHSFRNTLSSLKYFTQMANKTVEHVSEVLDYILYESNTESVSLEMELKFLNEFIDLYKIRMNSLNAVSFKNGIEVSHPLYKAALIPPLVTAYFIENAFKHGDLESENALMISIDIQNNELIYTVSNRMKQIKEAIHGGIGQKNMADRLQIMANGKYYLNYEIQNNLYISTLKLKL